VDIAATGSKKSGWITLATAAKADVWLRVVGFAGNGVTSPAFGRIDVQVR